MFPDVSMLRNPKNSPYIHVHGLDTAPKRNDGTFRDSCDLIPIKNHSGGSTYLPRPMSQTPAIVSHRFSIQSAMVRRFSTARLVGDSGMAKDGNIGAGSGGPVPVFSVVCKDID